MARSSGRRFRRFPGKTTKRSTYPYGSDEVRWNILAHLGPKETCWTLTQRDTPKIYDFALRLVPNSVFGPSKGLFDWCRSCIVV